MIASIDWPALIVAILMHRDGTGRRLSATEIARRVGCSKSRITKLRRPGTEPLHSLGVGLVALHVEVIGGDPPQIMQVFPTVNETCEIKGAAQ